MASYAIDELITGIPLFVPDAYDYFSIDAGGMPNGDDCLIVHGDVSTDYKAFQRAQVLSPAIFTSKDYSTVLDTMSIVFWIKSSPVTFTGNGVSQAVIFTVMSASANPTTDSETTFMGSGALWSIYASSSGTNQLGMFKRTANSGGGATADFVATPPTDVWTMVTMNPSQATDGGIYLNDDVSPSDTWSATGNGTFPGTTINGGFLCIGPYSTSANLHGRPDEYRLGKLSFHDHHLNLTERSLLYNAM